MLKMISKLAVVIAITATSCSTGPSPIVATNPLSQTVSQPADNVHSFLASKGYGYIASGVNDELLDELAVAFCDGAATLDSFEDMYYLIVAVSSMVGYTEDETIILAAAVLGAYCPSYTEGWS